MTPRFGFKGWKIYCEEGEHKFLLTDAEMDRFIVDPNFIIKCPVCGSDKVNLLEVEGQNKGY